MNDPLWGCKYVWAEPGNSGDHEMWNHEMRGFPVECGGSNSDVTAPGAVLHGKNLPWRTWMELSKGLIELAIFCGWHQRVAKQARQAALNSACWRRMREVRRASLTCLAEVCFATKETFLSCLYSLLASKYQDKHGLCLICTHYIDEWFCNIHMC